jgi:hypothetical protein
VENATALPGHSGIVSCTIPRRKMQYTRHRPSERYQQLITLYREMHLNGDQLRGNVASDTFDGRSLVPQAQRIKGLIERTGAARILDYGSGKGKQYDPAPLVVHGQGQWDSVLDYWGVDEVVCFDPAYPPYSRMPTGRFDGVIATDVLEHCPEEDMPWIVDEIFAFSIRFVYAAIACYPAVKRLPNGENAHCTIRPPDWWNDLFRRTAARHGDVRWEAWLQRSSPTGSRAVEELRLASC